VIDHDRLDVHFYFHPNESSDRVTEKLDQIHHAVARLATQEKADTKMVSAQIQAFSDRVNSATNEIASDLKALRDKVAAGQPLSPEDVALLDSAASRLEVMGVDPENPVPPAA